jgi:hypothetical protein
VAYYVSFVVGTLNVPRGVASVFWFSVVAAVFETLAAAAKASPKFVIEQVDGFTDGLAGGVGSHQVAIEVERGFGNGGKF